MFGNDETIRCIIPGILMFLYVVFAGSVMMIFFYVFNRCQKAKDFEPFFINHEISKVDLEQRFHRNDFIISMANGPSWEIGNGSTGTTMTTLDEPKKIKIVTVCS